MSSKLGPGDFFRLVFKPGAHDVSADEVAYFREHPEELDEISAPVSVHIAFLIYGSVAGILLVGVSKLLKYSGILDFLGVEGLEFVVDVVFEIGVALVGAAVTAYVLGILLNQQQSNMTTWRSEVRRRIEETEHADVNTAPGETEGGR